MPSSWRLLPAGWSFTPDPVGPEMLGVGDFPLFALGRARKAQNVIRVGDARSRVSVFDYRYSVGAGQDQHTVVQTVVPLLPFVLSLRGHGGHREDPTQRARRSLPSARLSGCGP